MTHEELLSVIMKAVEENSTKLDLSNKSLAVLPPEIRHLTKLTYLNLSGNQLTVLPPEIAQLTKLTDLLLHSNPLSMLPPEIGQLTNLTLLDLSCNPLSMLPPEIGQLTNVKALDLCANQFTMLPQEIGQLTKLTYLKLSDNWLTMLPPEIWQLTNLTFLDLSGNPLTALPKEIGQLTKLTYLNLSSDDDFHLYGLTPFYKIIDKNGLTVLPSEIWQLTNLTQLHLNWNQLSLLPPEIGELTNLTYLSLNGNQLSMLPSEIGKLTNLTKLRLEHNKLTRFPPEIGKLTNLTELRLEHNKLTMLPQEIGQLTNVKALDLRGNQLTMLPQEIGQLTKLTWLSLSGNQLTMLPPEMGHLTNLEVLKLDDNPMQSPPLEIVNQGTKAILTYLQALNKQGTRRQWNSKMVLIGEARVGKTSLLRALRDEPFNEQTPSTLGMDAHIKANVSLELLHPEKPEVKMQLFVWDFGGQQIYHATHQFFLTDKSLFVLVWNGGQSYEQCRLEYWLNIIKARAPGSPILIVATHGDQRPAEVLPLKEWQKAYNLLGSYEVSNKTGQGLEGLKEAIAMAATSLPLMGQEYPRDWIKAINTIQNNNKRHKLDSNNAQDYFYISELLRLLKDKHGMKEKEARVMLQWFHDLGGLLIYPDDPELNDLAILKPWWVSQVINRVLDYKDPALDRGLFTLEHMKQVWSDVPQELRPRFLILMEKFDLSYRIPEGGSIVVGRLPADPPDYETPWNDLKERGRQELTLRYRFPSIPPGIPSWFIAREHRFTTGLHWRHGVLLKDEVKKHLGLVRTFPNQRTVELSVRGPHPQNFFALLKDGLEMTIARFPGLEVRRMVPCPCGGNGKPCEEEYDHAVLVQREEKGKTTIECPRSDKELYISHLLFGWGDGGGRQEELLKAMKAEMTEGFGRQEARSQELLAGYKEVAAFQQRNFTTIFNLLQTSQDTHCPNVFLLRSVSRNRVQDTFTHKLELQLFCQEPGNWHATTNCGRYQFERLEKWLQPILLYARKLMKFLRYGAPILEMATGNKIREDMKGLESMEELIKLFPPEKEEQVSVEQTVADGAALRHLRVLLDEVDKSQHWGGLKKVTTAEGHCLWLCPEHAAKYRR